MSLPLVTDRQLRRPAALGRDQPQIVSSRDVRHKNNRLAIGRPCRIPYLPRHVKAPERKAFFGLLNISIRFGCDLLRIGNGLRWSQALGDSDRAHEYDDSKLQEKSAVHDAVTSSFDQNC